MYYAYIMESKEGHRSTGMTDDIALKLRQQNEKSSIWTKRGTKWKVIFMEEFSDEATALKREIWLKTAAGKYYVSNMLEQSKSTV